MKAVIENVHIMFRSGISNGKEWRSLICVDSNWDKYRVYAKNYSGKTDVNPDTVYNVTVNISDSGFISLESYDEA